jgi:uncharacterized protein YqjF (DUF2071 family)
MASSKFLTAEWRKLIMINYKIDPSILLSYLPGKTELDYWNNNCYVSLVGFMFQNVRVKGIKIPFHINFPEVNLRFYVRFKDKSNSVTEEWKRGVVFISEIVPKPAISFIANTLFHENYSTMPMKFSWKNDNKEIMKVGYSWKKKGCWNKMEVIVSSNAHPLVSGSEEEFITEHFWGYSAYSKEKTSEYHVVHPRWDIYPVNSFILDCDFESLYGSSFASLTGKEPDSVFLAEGSAIEVFQKRIL